MSRVIVIGGGAAGMMVAIAAGRGGHSVTLLEKNEKLGKKIYITGKGRCNFTNACDVSEFFDNVTRNPKFLYSAVYGFTNRDMIDLVESQGIPTKTERGGRVFPVSDHASDITKALEKELRRLSVDIRLNTEVVGIVMSYPVRRAGDEADISDEKPKVCGVRLADGKDIEADAVIVATGGLSYQTTGSTGDGHRMLSSMDVNVTDCHPSLVPLITWETDTHGLAGLSLKNVDLILWQGKKRLYEGFGEMLFTHEGISGPLALSASSNVTGLFDRSEIIASLDFKPALNKEKLYDRVCRDIEASPKRELMYLMSGLLPKSLAAVVMGRLLFDTKKHLCDITKDERKQLVDILKDFRMTVTGTGDFKEAIITRGGVSVKEIDPSTMRVKKYDGLFVAGELIDVDALTGGFNLQIAFSTGYLAGSSIE